MKWMFILSIAPLLCGPFVFGQQFAINNCEPLSFGDPHPVGFVSSASNSRTHCAATRAGEVFLISGGAALTVAVLYSNNSSNSPNVGIFLLAVYGALGVGGGAILFAGGEIYDHRRNSRFSLIGTRNQMGLAYTLLR
jgi:hypothetical protein